MKKGGKKKGKKQNIVEQSDDDEESDISKPALKIKQNKEQSEDEIGEDLKIDPEEEVPKPIKKSGKQKNPNKQLSHEEVEDMDVSEPANSDNTKVDKQEEESVKSNVAVVTAGGDIDKNGEVENTNKEDSVEEVSEKLASTEITTEKLVEKKLTHKEKKKMKKQQEYEKQMETLLKKGGQGHSELDSNFTVSQMQKTVGQMAALENAVDIKIENFSISAKGNDLFINANLLIAQGRHYGLVGPNG